MFNETSPENISDDEDPELARRNEELEPVNDLIKLALSGDKNEEQKAIEEIKQNFLFGKEKKGYSLALEIICSSTEKPEVIEKVMNILEEGMKSDTLFNSYFSTSSVLRLAGQKDKEEESFLTEEVKTRARAVLENGLKSDGHFQVSTISELATLFDMSDKAITINQEIFSWAEKLIKENSNIFDLRTADKHRFYCSTIILSHALSHEKIYEEAKKIIYDYISSTGLDPKETLTAWAKSSAHAWHNLGDEGNHYSRNENFSGIISKNLFTLKEIYNECPEAPVFLANNFGIYDFGRYGKKVLISQFENRDDHKSPYGVIVYPRSDWNAVFYDNKSIIEQTINDLEKNGILSRIIECETIVRIYGRLQNLDQVYNNDSNKILFAIISGHGSPNTISFGFSGPKQIHLLSKDKLMDLDNKEDNISTGIKKAKDFFVDNPEVVLISCSVGVQGGIAEDISDKFDANVTAAVQDTNVEKIDVNIVNGKLKFKVRYSKNEQQYFAKE